MSDLPAIPRALLEGRALDPDALTDAFRAAEFAAGALFDAGALEDALLAWDFILQAGERHDVGNRPRPNDARLRWLLGRARTLDHLDRLDEALEAYSIAATRAVTGNPSSVRFIELHAARLADKIARREAGKPYRRHTRGFRPERLDVLLRIRLVHEAEWGPWRTRQRLRAARRARDEPGAGE